MAVASYEFDKVAGVTHDNEHFRQVVKSLTGPKTFVAVPVQVLELQVDRVMADL
jgi:hypothetical protein